MSSRRWPTKPCEELNATAEQRSLYAERFKPRHLIKGQISKVACHDQMHEM